MVMPIILFKFVGQFYIYHNAHWGRLPLVVREM